MFDLPDLVLQLATSRFDSDIDRFFDRPRRMQQARRQ